MRLTAMIAILALTACGQTGDGLSGPTTSMQPTVESTTTTTLPSVDPTSTTTAPSKSTSTASTDESNDEQTAPGDPEYPESGMTENLLDAMVADAAERAGVDSTQVEIVSVTEETFNDSSLGCSEPGQTYTQVITPGHVVIVQAGGAQLDYRVGTQPESFKLCD